jgi:hypothetical protein
VPDREDRGNRQPSVFEGHELPLTIHAKGAPSREVGDRGALRQRDEIGILQGDQCVARSGGGPEPLAHVEGAVWMGNAEAHGPIVSGFAPPERRGQRRSRSPRNARVGQKAAGPEERRVAPAAATRRETRAPGSVGEPRGTAGRKKMGK